MRAAAAIISASLAFIVSATCTHPKGEGKMTHRLSRTSRGRAIRKADAMHTQLKQRQKKFYSNAVQVGKKLQIRVLPRKVRFRSLPDIAPPTCFDTDGNPHPCGYPSG